MACHREQQVASQARVLCRPSCAGGREGRGDGGKVAKPEGPFRGHAASFTQKAGSMAPRTGRAATRARVAARQRVHRLSQSSDARERVRTANTAARREARSRLAARNKRNARLRDGRQAAAAAVAGDEERVRAELLASDDA